MAHSALAPSGYDVQGQLNSHSANAVPAPVALAFESSGNRSARAALRRSFRQSGTKRVTDEQHRVPGPGDGDGLGIPPVAGVPWQAGLALAPPINRATMAPLPWTSNGASESAIGTSSADPGASEAARPVDQNYWQAAGQFRRLVLVGLVLTQTYLATSLMAAVLPYHGREPLEIAIVTLFAILFGWVSAGFWTAIAGFAIVLAGHDRYAISATAVPDAPVSPAVRTAVVMPICNEDVPRVFAGLRATYESLARTDLAMQFDMFVLSDTNNADSRVAEVEAWFETCRALDAFGRIFYRWRQHRIKRKSGNIADFCRRWGRNYRYLVILDADSVMSGECLSTLVRLMEANPGAGIIQTAPNATGRDTLHARAQQFASRVYGPLFTAGLHFWQLGESHYWGHNAIIRVEPFMRHCGLRRLTGRGLLSGEILSHDFVEAALMRRAGWSVWIAYDVPGSYEEMPPNLIDELKRDRRWCQGNLMNFRLSVMNGLQAAHRAVFVSGVMAYAAGLLWLAFLVLSTILLAVQILRDPQYFVAAYQLFPLWPEWHPEWALTLAGVTAGLLFLPKLLAAFAVAAHGAKPYGGGARLFASVLGESVVSMLLAPIRMLFHARFVVTTLCGWGVAWRSPPRNDAETTWSEAWRQHGTQTLIGLVWAAAVYSLNPGFLWWLLPVLGALIVAIPLSVLSSRVSLGRKLRDAGLFVIPEESHPPREIQTTMEETRRADGALPGFVEGVVDPAIVGLLCATGHVRPRPKPALRARRATLVRAALQRGPDDLSPADRMRLLCDPVALAQLHQNLWTAPHLRFAWTGVRASRTARPALRPAQ